MRVLHRNVSVLMAIGLVWTAIGAACANHGFGRGRAPDGPATPWRVVTGPRIFTGDPVAPWASAVVVDRGGRVVEVVAPGAALPSHSVAGVGLEVVRLPGALATPGLGDGHVHLAWLGEGEEVADLTGALSVAEIAARVRAHAVLMPEATVIRGRGWDQNLFENKAFPRAEDLAGVDARGRPIVLTRIDGHAVWLDGAALAVAEARGWLEAGQGGARVMRAADGTGRPTGVIVDPVEALWEGFREPGTVAAMERRFVRALTAVARAGLVEVHDMATRVEDLEALQAALKAVGPGAPRVVVYLADSEAAWTWLEDHAPGPVALGPKLAVAGVKLFGDGALGSRGALLHEAYADEAGHCGAGLEVGVLTAAVGRAMRAGFDVAIHAIGDAAVARALTAIEAATAEVGGTSPRRAGRHRHRIEHAQVIRPLDMQRFAELGVIASQQPTHATSDAAWAEARLGPERVRWAYAARSLAELGVALVFGSDAPIEAFHPVAALKSAVLRPVPAGLEAATWLLEQRVSVATALQAMSLGLAYATGNESRRGRVVVGMPLELTVFDVDFVAVPERLHGDVGVIGRVIAHPNGIDLVWDLSLD